MLDTSKIDNILNKYLARFGVTAFAGTDFAYYWEDETISYAFVVSERMDRLFFNYAKSIGLKTNVNVFILSLLHEVGHHIYTDAYDSEEEIYFREFKEAINGDSDEECMEYFSCPDEHDATVWAIDYIDNHIDELKRLWNDLQSAIIGFYYENGIIE